MIVKHSFVWYPVLRPDHTLRNESPTSHKSPEIALPI